MKDRDQDRREDHSHSDRIGAGHLAPDTYQELLRSEDFRPAADSGFAARDGRGGRRGELYRAHNVGKFVRPQQNDWASHRHMVLAEGMAFQAGTGAYTFDHLIAKHAHFPAALDPSNRHYQDYQALRLNLAVLRNYLNNHFFPDGRVAGKPNASEDDIRLGQVALEVARMIRSGHSLLPSLGPTITAKELNLEGIGGAKLYQKLLGVQTRERLTSPLLFPYRLWSDRRDREWRLPPISETPFDPRNLSAPISTSDSAPPPMGFGLLGEELAITASSNFGRVEDLSAPVKTRAIELAEDILKKMRVQFGALPVSALIDHADPVVAHHIFTGLGTVSSTFRDQLARAAQADGAILQDREVQGALAAFGMLSFQAQRFALRSAEQRGDTAAAQAIFRQIQGLPAEWKHPGAVTLGALASQVQGGLARVLGRLRESAPETDTSGMLGGGLAAAGALGGGTVLAAHGSPAATAPGTSPLTPASAPPVTPQAAMLRDQQLRASQDHARREPSREGQNAPPSAAARPPARAATNGNALRPPKMPKMNRDSIVVPPAAPAPAALGNLVSASQIAQMRSSLAASTTGPAINPATGDKASKIHATKAMRAAEKQPVVKEETKPEPPLPPAGPSGVKPRHHLR